MKLSSYDIIRRFLLHNQNEQPIALFVHNCLVLMQSAKSYCIFPSSHLSQTVTEQHSVEKLQQSEREHCLLCIGHRRQRRKQAYVPTDTLLERRRAKSTKLGHMELISCPIFSYISYYYRSETEHNLFRVFLKYF